jgi:hypothetical protein
LDRIEAGEERKEASVSAWNTTRRGKLYTIDLLIKETCFVNNIINIKIS